MHWWPRQTPSTGSLGPNRLMMSLETPPSRGVQGPGEMTMCVGLRASTWSAVTLSLRKTSIFSEAPPTFAELLHEVVGERIVVVDQDEHGCLSVGNRRGKVK